MAVELPAKKRELANVRAELGQAKEEFLLKCHALEIRLQRLELSGQEVGSDSARASTPSVSSTSGERPRVELRTPAPTTALAPPESATKSLEQAPVEPIAKPMSAPVPPTKPMSAPVPPTESAFETVASALAGPFLAPFGIVRTAYAQAQQEGRLAIFFLTLLGVVTTLIGTAYVLQYGFSNWLTLTAKLGLSEAVALALTAGGARLWKGDSFREFGSALIGLGVVMSYLVVYFATESFHLLSPPWGFAGLAFTTCLAYALARLYETKIVASLMLFGGALTPFLLDLEIALNPVYQGFLLSLCVASLQLSRRVPWPALGKHAFLLSAAILELGVFGPTEREASAIHIVLLEAFHGLFALWLLTQGRKLVTELSIQSGLLLCANVGVLVTTLWGQIDSTTSLSLLLAANAAPYVTLGVMRRSRSRPLAGGLLAVGSALVGLALTVACQLDTMGLLLAQEGLLLVLLGGRWELKTLRREGYALVLGAGLVSLFVWMRTPSPVDLLSTPYLNLITLGFTLGALQLLTRRYASPNSLECDRDDAWVAKGSGEALSVWFAGACMWTIVRLFPVYGWHCVVLPMALLVWRGERKSWPVTQLLGFGLGTLLLVPALRSIVEVQSFRFTLQLASGKLAMLEILATLWVGPVFMRRISPGSSSMSVLNKLQLGVYLALPVIWLPSIARRWPEGKLLLFWGSTVISGALAWAIRARGLRSEFWGLCLMACGVMVLGAGSNGFSTSDEVTAWTLGLGLQGLLVLLVKGHTRNGANHWLARPVLTGGVFYLGALIALSAGWLGVSDSGSACLAGMYFLALPHVYKHYAPLRRVLRPVTQLGQLSLLAAVVLAGWSQPQLVPVFWVCLSAAAFAFATYCKNRVSLLVLSSNPRKREKPWRLELYVSHALVFSSYAAVLAHLTGSATGIALTVAMVMHGIVLLAQLLRPRFAGLRELTVGLFLVALAKLFLLDLRFASTIQKMVAFIALGGLCLGAAYAFQRVAKKTRSENAERPPARE